MGASALRKPESRLFKPEPEPVAVTVTDPIHLPERESVKFSNFEKVDVQKAALDFV